MKVKRSAVAFVFFLILQRTTSLPNNAVLQKRMAAEPYRSFSHDFNACLFGDWVIAGILSKPVDCNSPGEVQLCYGNHNGGKALFAVCYNTNTLIPEFTGHVLQSGGTVGAPDMVYPPDLYDPNWRTDERLVQDDVPVAVVDDYECYSQAGKFANHNVDQNQFLAKGHLTPNGDFRDDNNERSFTTITTNIAPQWQPFNVGNWAVLEAAVKAYAGKKPGRTLFVFTGTGGKAQYDNQDIRLKDRVLTPKYFWKAVCDPALKQSMVFVAENTVGVVFDPANPSPGDKAVGCNGKEQTKMRGIIYCYRLEVAAQVPDYADFKLPPFSDANCNPNQKGTFLDTFLNKLQ